MKCMIVMLERLQSPQSTGGLSSLPLANTFFHTLQRNDHEVESEKPAQQAKREFYQEQARHWVQPKSTVRLTRVKQWRATRQPGWHPRAARRVWPSKPQERRQALSLSTLSPPDGRFSTTVHSPLTSYQQAINIPSGGSHFATGPPAQILRR